MLRIGLAIVWISALSSSICPAEDSTQRMPRTGQEWLDYLKSKGSKSKSWSLGAKARTYRSSNGYFSVQITDVTNGSPATKLKLPPDLTHSYRLVPYRDFIVKVDGKTVHTMDDLKDHLNAADDWATLRVYDSHTKKYGNYYVKIR